MGLEERDHVFQFLSSLPVPILSHTLDNQSSRCLELVLLEAHIENRLLFCVQTEGLSVDIEEFFQFFGLRVYDG